MRMLRCDSCRFRVSSFATFQNDDTGVIAYAQLRACVFKYWILSIGAEQNRTAQNSAKRNRAEYSQTEQNRTEQSRTEQSRTEQSRA